MRTQRMERAERPDHSRSSGLPAGNRPEKTASVQPPVQNVKPGVRLSLDTGSYTVIAPFDKAAGESELFILEHGGKKFVFKLYFPHVEPKREVLETLSSVDHPYILSPIEFGMLSGRFFELLPLAEGGSLAARPPVKDTGTLLKIVERVVDALVYCHGRGILHRDIKPENLLCAGACPWEVMVSDFGIASLLREDQTRHLTSQAFTFGYAAPELFGYGGRVYVGKEADYYALGMTLIHIWEGRNPFGDLSAYAISNLTTSGNIRIPDDMPQPLSDLVRGLIHIDYRTRWGEKEVRRRLAGIPVPLPAAARVSDSRPFMFDSEAGVTRTARTPREAALLLEQFPELGKKHLYRKTLAGWLFLTDPSLFQKITDLTDSEFPDNQDAGLVKAVYLLDQGRPFTSRSGVLCATPEEIGRELDRDAGFYRHELSENAASEFYLFLEARGYGKAAEIFRSYFTHWSERKSFNLIVISLLGERLFPAGPAGVRTVEDINNLPASDKENLWEAFLEEDSRFLVWLERRGFLSGSAGILDPDSRAEIFTIFPWTVERFRKEGFEEPDRSDGSGYTALHHAVISGDIERVRRLLASGADPRRTQKSGWTALHLASRYDRVGITRLLLEHGAEMNAVTASGDTPLHIACRSGAEKTAGYLLGLKVRTDLRNSDGLRAAAVALSAGFPVLAGRVISSGGVFTDAEVRILRKRNPHVPAEKFSAEIRSAGLSGKKSGNAFLFVLPFCTLASAALALFTQGGLKAVFAVFCVPFGVLSVLFWKKRS